jgi:hypothetical protein
MSALEGYVERRKDMSGRGFLPCRPNQSPDVRVWHIASVRYDAQIRSPLKA